jgi:molecular chaperone IbpA
LLNKGEIKMTQLQRFDTNALARALVGFDRMFDDMEHRFANQINNNYPPHNIIKTGDNDYRIEVAVAGFSKNEIAVELEDNHLTIRGESQTTAWPSEAYLHRGLASRDFTKVFPLAEHIKVKGAQIENGILAVMLERIVPEELKPRVIEVVEVK